MKKGLLIIAATLLLCAAVARAETPLPPAGTLFGAPAPKPTAAPKPSAPASSAPAPTAPAPAPTQETKAGGAKAIILPPEKAKPVSLVKFEKPPTIDGKLDDEVWKGAARFKDFYQFQPGDNIAPSKPTEVLMGYDSKFLYIAFNCADDPEKVRATVAKRDNVFGEDNVRIYLDTFNDRRKAYVLGFNPLGVQQDGIFTEAQGIDYSVDVVMESKGMLTTDGWVVEVAIPFKSLRFVAGKDKLWGIHIWRNIDRFNDELDSWMPISRDKSGTLNQAGHLTGIEGVSTERTFELIPSLTVSETGKSIRTMPSSVAQRLGVVDQGRFVNQPIEFDPGLTAKLGLTQSITLDLALNPDFAQVEADATVVTANQRFPIFFEEKRPFFLEGKEIFTTQIAAVHTRAIIDPDVAVKLSGKSGRNTFGLLLASDNAPGNFSEEERTDPDVLPDIARFIDKNAYIGVLRLKRDVGKENSIGLLATTYNFIEKHNHLGGFDARVRFDPKTTLDVQVLGSTSRRFFFEPNLGRSLYRTGNGFIYAYNFNNNHRHLRINFNGVGRTKDYRSDVGFNRRTNTNNHNSNVSYTTEPNPKGRLVSWNFYNYFGGNFDWQGRMQNWNHEFQTGPNLQRSTFIRAGYNWGYERVFEYEFGTTRDAPCVRAANPDDRCTPAFFGPDNERTARLKNVFAYGGSQLSKKYYVFVFTGYRWGAIDFDFGGGPKYPRVSPAALLLGQDAPLDPGAGNLLEMNVEFVYKPTNELNSALFYTKNRMVRRDTKLVAFDENIISSRTTYQFTRFIFARARVDYATLSSSLRGQFLLGWTPNPGTAFYVGYNDDLTRNGLNPFSGQLEPGFRRNGRTFFIKMSYLFRRSL